MISGFRWDFSDSVRV